MSGSCVTVDTGECVERDHWDYEPTDPRDPDSHERSGDSHRMTCTDGSVSDSK